MPVHHKPALVLRHEQDVAVAGVFVALDIALSEDQGAAGVRILKGF